MEISKPMLWRETASHESDCYFCLSTKSGFGKHMRWCYPTRSGAGYTLPVLYSDGSQYPKSIHMEVNTYATCNQVVSSPSTSSVSYKSDSLAPKLYTQAQVNDLVRDLELSKEKSELLASHLKDQNFLERNVKTTVYRTRHKPYSEFFLQLKTICAFVTTFMDFSISLAKHTMHVIGGYSSTAAKKALKQYYCTMAIRSHRYPLHTPWIWRNLTKRWPNCSKI